MHNLYISKINFIFIYILFLFLLGCNSEEQSITDNKVNEENKPKMKYRTYKNEAPMMNTGRKKLERLNDIEDAKRNILKTYDSYKPKISPNPE